MKYKMPGIRRAAHCGLYIKRSLIRLELGPYWFWAFLRIFLTILPQTGYIHPDEFFQSVEVFAGTVLDTKVNVPWEYNGTHPVRSVPVMYMATSLPLSLLKKISQLIGSSELSPYILLVFPRLCVCLLSFVSDYCLYRICYLYGQNFRKRLLIYASSYVTLTYGTRTFSNTIEMFLFNILLYLVASCMAESEKINYQDQFLLGKYREATTTADRVRILKLRKLLPTHSIHRCFPIALVTVAGVFNRPTFLTYAVPPVFYWLQRGIHRDEPLLHFHSRFFLLLFCAIPVTLIFIFLDSAYFGYITWGEIINGRIGFHSFVVTPLNFLRYNLDKKNLEEHGLHPRWLHIVVNLPLLFNLLAIVGLLVMVNMLYRGSQAYWTELPKPQSITGMMSLSAIIPVMALSVIPHQEPRFIAPLLLPLVFLYSHVITQFVEDCPAPAPRATKHKQLPYIDGFDNRPNITGRFLTLINHEAVTGKPSTGIGRYELLKCWFIINIIFTAFYGFIHQGGVYQLTQQFRSQLDIQPQNTTHSLLYSHTYPIPQYLLMQPISSTYRAPTFHIERLSSNTESNVRKISNILKIAEQVKKFHKRDYKVFYALPASALAEFEVMHPRFSDSLLPNFSLKVKKVFFPHLSLEAPFHLPDIMSWKDVRRCFELTLIEILVSAENL